MAMPCINACTSEATVFGATAAATGAFGRAVLAQWTAITSRHSANDDASLRR